MPFGFGRFIYFEHNTTMYFLHMSNWMLFSPHSHENDLIKISDGNTPFGFHRFIYIYIYMKGQNPKSGICDDFEVYCDLRAKSKINIKFQYGYVPLTCINLSVLQSLNHWECNFNEIVAYIYMKGPKPKGWICNDFEVYWDLRTKSRIKVVSQYGYVIN